MASYTQYSNNGSYSTPSTQIVNIALNDTLPIGKDYLVMQTGQYTYVAIIGDYTGGTFVDVDIVTISRPASNGVYTVSRTTADSVTYTVSNDYYVYSSIGLGQFVSYPRTDYYMCLAVVITCVFTVLATVMRNLLPRWGCKRVT